MFPLGVPVVTSPLLPDGHTVTAGGVTILGVSEGGAIAVRIVRAGLADVLAWLGPAAPDMRTGVEIRADHRAVIRVPVDAPTFLAGAALLHLTTREEGPCVWCEAWTVRWRRPDLPISPIACKPSHRTIHRVPGQTAREASQARRAAKEEDARQAACPRPNKRHWSFKHEALIALTALRVEKPSLPNTVHVYRCDCGAFHLGDRAKTLTWRINQSRKERARRAGR